MTTNTQPILTIVTALLDGDEAVFETADSLTDQLGADCRWLVKLSTERPRTDLSRLQRLPFVDVVKQSDDSIYAGLNQALGAIGSDWFMVVGAGDKLVPGGVPALVQDLTRADEIDAVFFGTRHLGSRRDLLPRPADLPVRMACPHPSSLLRTTKALQIGGFDTGYKIAADYDLMSRYVRAFSKVAWSDRILVEFKGQGMSERRALEGALEEELVRRRVWQSSDLGVCERMLELLPRYRAALRRMHAMTA